MTGKCEVPGLLRAGQKQYEDAEQMVVLAIPSRTWSRKRSPPLFTTTVAVGNFSLRNSNNDCRMVLQRPEYGECTARLGWSDSTYINLLSFGKGCEGQYPIVIREP